MRFITGAAISKRSVTLLAIFLLLISGVTAYNTLRVDLFPDIEFPLVTVTTAYPSANPEAVVRDVTAPIESIIDGTQGLETVQSTTFEGNSIVLANFKFGTDMAAAETHVESVVSGLEFPAGVERPTVGRFRPDQFPIVQFSAISDRDPTEIRRIVQSQILPALSEVDGILDIQVTGEVERRVNIYVDPDRLRASGVSLFQVSMALTENNLSMPAGLIFESGQAVPAKTTHAFGSVEEIADLIVGASEAGPVRLKDVADVRLGQGRLTSLSRTNGKPSVSVSILKEADANTVEVSNGVREALDGLTGLPPDVELVIVSDQGPDIQSQIDKLRREGIFGFLFAVTVVFAFMFTIRPTFIRGMFNTIRPTVVIGLSIPLSVFTGVLLLAWQDLTLNFMTLGGLAISVGARGGRLHCRAGERIPPHSGRPRPMAGGAGRHHGGWPGHLRVHNDYGGGVHTPGLHRGPCRVLLRAFRAHRHLCAAGVSAGGPDRRARAGRVPAEAGRPAGRRGWRGG